MDWLGLGLLAFVMVMLISGLHASSTAGSAPWGAIVPLVLAAMGFAALHWAETRNRQPLFDFALFSNQTFALACLLSFLLMFDIMTLLLYYNLFAQAPSGARAAGLEDQPHRKVAAASAPVIDVPEDALCAGPLFGRCLPGI